MRFEQRLAQIARTLPDEPTPPALRARVLNDLAAPSPTTNRPLPRRRLLRVSAAAAGLALAAGGAGLLFAPRPFVPSLFAAELRAAVGRANTWHFSGWRLQNGVKVRWEVWGRRAPFFYREQVGNEVLFDDGNRRVRLLPADPANGRAQGVALILPSQPLGTNVEGRVYGGSPGANFLAGIGDDGHELALQNWSGPQVAFWKSTDILSNPVIRETTMLLADKLSRLPVRYTIRRAELRPQGSEGEGAGRGLDFTQLTLLREYTQAELIPAYDVTLPGGIEQMNPPAGYRVADATRPPANIDLGDPSVASQNGLTVKAEAIARDNDGNLHLRLRGWLGEQPFRYPDLPMTLNARVGPGWCFAADERGHRYLSLGVPPGAVTNGMTPHLWLVPVEPFIKGAPRPRTLDLTVPIHLSQYERMGKNLRLIPVVSTMLRFKVRLPDQAQNLGFDDYREEEFRGKRPTLLLTAAQSRAMYYQNGGPEQYGKTVRMNELHGATAHSAYWWEVAANEAERIGNQKQATAYRQNADQLRRFLSGQKAP